MLAIDLGHISKGKGGTVRAVITAVVKFKNVRGSSDEDRIGSVREVLERHYDDIVKNSYFADGIASLTVEVLGKGAMTDREAIEKIANILSMDDCFEDEKADRIRDVIAAHNKGWARCARNRSGGNG